MWAAIGDVTMNLRIHLSGNNSDIGIKSLEANAWPRLLLKNVEPGSTYYRIDHVFFYCIWPRALITA